MGGALDVLWSSLARPPQEETRSSTPKAHTCCFERAIAVSVARARRAAESTMVAAVALVEALEARESCASSVESRRRRIDEDAGAKVHDRLRALAQRPSPCASLWGPIVCFRWWCDSNLWAPQDFSSRPQARARPSKTPSGLLKSRGSCRSLVTSSPGFSGALSWTQRTRRKGLVDPRRPCASDSVVPCR
jgi:hypothetical protein